MLLVLNRPTWNDGQWFFLVDVTDALVYGFVGWLLLARVRRPVAWIVAGCALGGAVAALAAQWALFQLDHPSLPRIELLVAAQNWAWVPGTLGLILVAPWLVRHQPLDRIGEAGVAAGVVVTVGLVAFRWTDPYPWPDAPSNLPTGIEHTWWSSHYLLIDRWFMAAIVVVGAAAALDVVRRRRTLPTQDARRGLGWLAVGAGAMSITFLPLAVPRSYVDWLPITTTPLLHLVSQLFFPAALLVAVLGQQLWGLRIAVSRAVGWSMLTAGLLASYIALVGLSGSLMPNLDEGVQQVAAAATVAAAADPLRRFVQRRVDLLVHGDVREPFRAVDRLGGHVGAAGDPVRLLTASLEGIVESLRLSRASIDVAVGDQTLRARVGGSFGHDEVAVPLVLDGELVGVLTVWPRPGERLDQRTRRSLEALVTTAAVAALLAIRARELAESRTRIVAAREEERRVIRRELHDGLGPALAGVGYGIGAARNLMSTDPTAADHLLARLADEIDTQVEDIRTLARELVPPVLVDAGLAPAVVELAERVRMSGLSVQLEVDDQLDVPPESAAALYGIAAEAVRNVVRHADATAVTVRLRGDADVVVLEVIDDGRGIPADAVPDVGLQSMRERSAAIDADITIGLGPTGGSIVAVRMPLRRRATL